MLKSLGQNPRGAYRDNIRRSPNFRKGAFQNIEPTPLMTENTSMFKMTVKFFGKQEGRLPSFDIPFLKNDLSKTDAGRCTVTWFGHSSYLLQYKNYNVLVDPVLCGYAAPFPFLGRSFRGTNVYSPKDLPEIDLLIITHDHYDHLDYQTVTSLRSKVKQVVTPIGVGAHLVYWGYDQGRITELDWWEGLTISSEIELTCTPARHFSGRSFVRNQTLWASYCLNIFDKRIFVGGDSGYDAQFGVIGNRYGPFDLAVLESGQYGENWPLIHMTPEQTVQAAQDLGASVLMPVHWAKFALAFHGWNEPAFRIKAAAQEHRVNVSIPVPGSRYYVGEEQEQSEWWNRKENVEGITSANR